VGTPKKEWTEDMLETGFGTGRHEFDAYNYLKTELVKRGVPAEEVAFIHDAKSDAQRETLFKEMRSGKKKILIGSTDKCGTGVNVQRHLVAMHHVDCPWKPSSIEQREGRGIRQGNENDEVAVYRYVTKSTFDAYSWSIVENKQRFISQVMTSKGVSRTHEDVDEATLSYAEIKAVATGNPLIKEKMEVDNEVQRLRLLKSSFESKKYSLQDNFMIRFPRLIAAAREKREQVAEDVKRRDAALLAGGEFEIEVGGKAFTERVEAGTELLKQAAGLNVGERKRVGRFRGFEVYAEKTVLGLKNLILKGKAEYQTDLSTSPVGNAVKIENLFNSIQETAKILEGKIEGYENDVAASKEEYEKPFAYEEEYRRLLSRQLELNAALDLENKGVIDADLSENVGTEVVKVPDPGAISEGTDAGRTLAVAERGRQYGA
jgi:superfamily II DNA/RNA helicase